MFTMMFWRATAERCLSTVAQAAVAALAAGATGVLDADWQAVASVAGMAGILSVLKAIGAATIGSGDGPGIGHAETTTAPDGQP